MKTCNRLSAVLLFVLLGAGLSACAVGDARTQQVLPGMTRDEVVAILRAPLPGRVDTTAGDSSANIWRSAQYFVSGQMVEVLWYSPYNERRIASDTVPDRKVIPITLVDGKVVGVGIAARDSVSGVLTIPRDKY